MTERVLPRPDVAPPAHKDALAHIFCRVCYPGHPERARSMCGARDGSPVPVSTARTRPWCVVCMEYHQRRQCPRGHRLSGELS